MKKVLIFTAAALAAAVALALYWYRSSPVSRPADRDPRRDYAGPFQNVSPDIRYVAEESCAECHREKAKSYAQHPMGRSLFPVGEVASPPLDRRHNNPFQALDAQFGVFEEGNQVRQRRTRLAADGHAIATLEWEVHYAVGSGGRGHSYFTNRDGYLFQTPISWYSQKGAWDLSPGFGQSHLTGRPVLPECLFCHANRANHVANSVNRYTEPVFDGHAIGCQRCHGPGELHVAGRRQPVSEGIDYTIVNPRQLEWSLREAVCTQCHLLGEARVTRHGRGLYDFRPGLPLSSFISVFLPTPEAGKGEKAVSHVEQMYESRCFQGSEGAEHLGCISCHDPHRAVRGEERLAYYRQRCLTCHESRGCTEQPARRQMKQDSCVACHMPRYGSSDIPHTASTDHRILRQGAAEKQPHPDRTPFPLVAFFRREKTSREDERDLAVALVGLARAGNPSASRSIRRILPDLETAVRRDPNDLLAGEAHGEALATQSRWADALAAFEAVLARAPDRELTLVGAASMSEALGQTEPALGYWRRAVEANPWRPDYRRNLVLLLVKKEAWEEAGPECEAWLRLDPMSTEARSARVTCLLANGNKDEARAEFARIEALAPENLVELQARFGKRLK